MGLIQINSYPHRYLKLRTQSPGSPARDETFVLLSLDFAPLWSLAFNHRPHKKSLHKTIMSCLTMSTFTILDSYLLLYIYIWTKQQTAFKFSESRLGAKQIQTTPEIWRKVTTTEFHGQVTPAVAVESAVSVTLWRTKSNLESLITSRERWQDHGANGICIHLYGIFHLSGSCLGHVWGNVGNVGKPVNLGKPR